MAFDPGWLLFAVLLVILMVLMARYGKALLWLGVLLMLIGLLLAGCAGQPEEHLDYDAYCWLLTTESFKQPRQPWVYYLNTTCGTYEVPRWVFRSLGLGEPVGIIETEWFTMVVPGVLWRRP